MTLKFNSEAATRYELSPACCPRPSSLRQKCREGRIEAQRFATNEGSLSLKDVMPSKTFGDVNLES